VTNLQGRFGFATTETRVRTDGDEPRLATTIVSTLSSGRNSTVEDSISASHSSLHGAGTDISSDKSLLPAMGELLERYCASLYSESQFVWASANELGRETLDLLTIPRCSDTELSSPQCPLLSADLTKAIRWVRGLCLTTGEILYIPAMLVYLSIKPESKGERFWLPISTGCAVHQTYEEAILSAICEIVERDALSIMWLQQLPIPRLCIDHVPEQLECYWSRFQQSSKDIEYLFFDATTNVGIPTIYGMRTCTTNPRVATLVSCSTSVSPLTALIKVMRDLVASAHAFRHPRPIPLGFRQFRDVFHGATYMAARERSAAFEFLTSGTALEQLSSINSFAQGTPKCVLKSVLTNFQKLGHRVYAVDLTTDEALQVNMRAVRVLIPTLQPLGFWYAARFLGHSRLYEAPRAMGYRVRQEPDLNQWPQPFA